MPNELIDDYLNYFNKCEEQGALCIQEKKMKC